jgi:flagellar M-ring protein FliF
MGAELNLMGGVGFEVFDNSDFGMTEFAQKINFQRALEGELTRTIMSLKPVKYARVHIVMPEKGLFKEDDSKPSASVILFLNSNVDRNLSAIEIEGIQRLVSSSVPSMSEDAVTVSDENGLTLSQTLAASNASRSVDNKLKQKKAYESYLAEKLNSVLAKTFGAGVAMASVDVTLGYNEVKKTVERMLNDQQGGAVAKKKESVVKDSSSKKSKDQKTVTEIEYELGRSVEQTVELPGTIERLTLSLMIPSTLSTYQIEQIQSLAKSTVGWSELRGDAIAFYRVEPSRIQPEKLDKQNTVLPKRDTQIASVKMQQTQVDFIDWLKQYPLFSMAIFSLLIVALVYGLLQLLSSTKTVKDDYPQLTDKEKQRLLLNIQKWLDESDANLKKNEAL